VPTGMECRDGRIVDRAVAKRYETKTWRKSEPELSK
jgi:hypothetical protein